MKEIILMVEGMRCGMCESHVNEIVRNAVKAKKVKSNHRKKQTVVTADDDTDVQSIKAAIESQGYDVCGVAIREYKKRGIFRLK